MVNKPASDDDFQIGIDEKRLPHTWERVICIEIVCE